MDIFLYKNKIKEVNDKLYILKKKRNLFLGLIALGGIILTILLLTLIPIKTFKENELFVIIILYFVFTLIALFCIYYYKKHKFFFQDVSKLILQILTQESKFDITQITDQSLAREIIKDCKVCNTSDSITNIMAFEFRDELLNGKLFLSVIGDSSRKGAEVLNGVIVTFDYNAKCDYQIRDDKRQLSGYKKIKDLSNHQYLVLKSRDLEENDLPINYKDHYGYLVNTYFDKLKGLNYQEDKITFYFNDNNIMKFPKVIDEEYIETTCNILNEILETSQKFYDLINSEYEG